MTDRDIDMESEAESEAQDEYEKRGQMNHNVNANKTMTEFNNKFVSGTREDDWVRPMDVVVKPSEVKTFIKQLRQQTIEECVGVVEDEIKLREKERNNDNDCESKVVYSHEIAGMASAQQVLLEQLKEL